MEETYKRRGILVAALLAAFGIGAASAVGTGFTETVRVSYGNTDRVESDIKILDVEAVGPGINVHEVEVEVENEGTSDITFECSVYLMDGETVISDGSVTETVSAGESDTLVVDVDDTREHEYDAIDVRIEEV